MPIAGRVHRHSLLPNSRKTYRRGIFLADERHPPMLSASNRTPCVPPGLSQKENLPCGPGPPVDQSLRRQAGWETELSEWCGIAVPPAAAIASRPAPGGTLAVVDRVILDAMNDIGLMGACRCCAWSVWDWG